MSCEATVRQTMTYLHRYKQLKSYVLPGTLCLNIPAYLSQCFLDIDNVYERICLHLQCETHRSEIDYLLPSVFPPSHSSHSRALYLKATWWSHLAQDSQHQQSKNGSLSLFSTFSLSLFHARSETNITRTDSEATQTTHFSLPHSVLSYSKLGPPAVFLLHYDSLTWRVNKWSLPAFYFLRQNWFMLLNVKLRWLDFPCRENVMWSPSL